MATTAGHFPNFQTLDVTKIKQKGGGRMTTPGYEYDPGKGWHVKRETGWIKKGRSSGNVKLRTQTDFLGGKTKSYVVEGYDDYIGFHASDDGEQLAFAESAFDKIDPKGVGILSATPPGGHITKIEYNYESKVMRVTFRNDGRRGNQCLFVGVAAVIANQLLMLAAEGSMRADGRHLVGIKFWELVRIKHQRTGARLPFSYTGSHSSEIKGKRHKVVVSDMYAKKILGNKYYDARESYGAAPYGMKQEYVLNDDEYKIYQELASQGKLPIEKGEEVQAEPEKKEENAVNLGKPNSGIFGMGRQWKISDFENMKDEIEGADYKEYLNYLDNKDFQGALTFLKKQKRTVAVTVENKKTNGAIRTETYNIPKAYAGEYDEIDYNDYQRYKENEK